MTKKCTKNRGYKTANAMLTAHVADFGKKKGVNFL
jgi:hypothetical protein